MAWHLGFFFLFILAKHQLRVHLLGSDATLGVCEGLAFSRGSISELHMCLPTFSSVGPEKGKMLLQREKKVRSSAVTSRTLFI